MRERVCDLCHGKMIRKKVIYSQIFEGRLVVVEDVPAWVCEQCGEVFYEPDVVERLQELIWSRSEPQRVISVPVWEFETA